MVVFSHYQENMNHGSICSITDKMNAAAVFSPIFFKKRENYAKIEEIQ
tara:strand:+ start:482 stop:625 length:144 start_codon:yes stop_codon:yes gene_type:complete